MKLQIVSVLCSLSIVGSLFLFTSCSNSEEEIKAARSEAYEAGYNQGMEDSDNSDAVEEAYWAGFEDGAYEALSLTGDSSSHSIDDILSAADSFAYKETGRDVYEAWNDIMIYIDKSGTKTDLAKNAETLMLYCMYLDDYDMYYEPDFTDIFEE